VKKCGHLKEKKNLFDHTQFVVFESQRVNMDVGWFLPATTLYEMFDDITPICGPLSSTRKKTRKKKVEMVNCERKNTVTEEYL
jgi:hypothetical protein